MPRFAVILLLGFGGWAQSVPEIPAALKPPPGETLALQAQGVGDQIYTCDGASWTLLKPDARLLDESGKQVGLHFAGPTWQWSDGSRVIRTTGCQRDA